MQYKLKVLIVEDEQCDIDLLTSLLTAENYQTLVAKKGNEALQMYRSHHPDLILLDLGLPDTDGMEVLKNIRSRSEVPIIIVSSRQAEDDKVEALDSGAVDYVTKPFGNAELLARIRNALRTREKLLQRRQTEDGVYASGGLRIDYDAYSVTMNGHAVHLTPIEYKIVFLLSKNPGKVFTHEQIITQVWGQSNCDSQVLRVNMANIRKKLEPNPADPSIIVTELGVGYKMNGGYASQS